MRIWRNWSRCERCLWQSKRAKARFEIRSTRKRANATQYDYISSGTHRAWFRKVHVGELAKFRSFLQNTLTISYLRIWRNWSRCERCLWQSKRAKARFEIRSTRKRANATQYDYISSGTHRAWFRLHHIGELAKFLNVLQSGLSRLLHLGSHLSAV